MTRVNQAQMCKLLDLLSEEGVLDDGRVIYNDTNRQAFWKRIAMQLNAIEGGVQKNAWKWCKMWADWKTNAKKKANIILRRKKYKNYFPPQLPVVSELELRLLRVINYPLDNNMDALRFPTVQKMEVPDEGDVNLVYFTEDYSELQTSNAKTSDEEDNTNLDEFAKKNNFSDDDEILNAHKSDANADSTDTERKSKRKGKSYKKKKTLKNEYKKDTTLELQKERSHQRSEELRLKAIELKLKGDELRLKETEMNKINYLTNIEEEKLKCFRDISASLKELLERTKNGNNRFQNIL